MIDRGLPPRPELESRRAAGVAHGREELRALLDEGLVDDDEYLLAGAQRACADEVLAPARVLLEVAQEHLEAVGEPAELAAAQAEPDWDGNETESRASEPDREAVS